MITPDCNIYSQRTYNFGSYSQRKRSLQIFVPQCDQMCNHLLGISVICKYATKNYPKSVFKKRINLLSLKVQLLNLGLFSFHLIRILLLCFFAGIFPICIRHHRQKKHLDRIDRYMFLAKFRLFADLLALLLLPLHAFDQKRVLFPHSL